MPLTGGGVGGVGCTGGGVGVAGCGIGPAGTARSAAVKVRISLSWQFTRTGRPPFGGLLGFAMLRNVGALQLSVSQVFTLPRRLPPSATTSPSPSNFTNT